MGSKPSNAMQSNRPESGGTDHNDNREKSGLLDRDKEEFAKSEQAKRDAQQVETGGRETASNDATEDERLND
jgi:hypothetical protein